MYACVRSNAICELLNIIFLFVIVASLSLSFSLSLSLSLSLLTAIDKRRAKIPRVRERSPVTHLNIGLSSGALTSGCVQPQRFLSRLHPGNDLPRPRNFSSTLLRTAMRLIFLAKQRAVSRAPCKRGIQFRDLIDYQSSLLKHARFLQTEHKVRWIRLTSKQMQDPLKKTSQNRIFARISANLDSRSAVREAS